jgi:hypothetical protein
VYEELPPISHVRIHKQSGIIFDVRAYRALSTEEIRREIGAYLRDTPVMKRAKHGEHVACLTRIGATG